MCARAGFVHGINRLVGESTVGDVAACQLHASLQSLVRIGHEMMFLILALDVAQYLQRFFLGRWIYYHLLEASLQCTVLLNALAVFVECGCSDALYLTASQCRLQHVCSIH